MPLRFPKVASRSGFSLKNEGSRERKFGKICVLRAEILTKTRLKIEKFSKI